MKYLAFLLSLAHATDYSDDVELDSVYCDGQFKYVGIKSAFKISGIVMGGLCNSTDIEEFLYDNYLTAANDIPQELDAFDADKPYYTEFAFDPYECEDITPDPADVTTYSITSYISFFKIDEVDGVEMAFGEFELTAACEFKQSYSMEVDLGSLHFDLMNVNTTGTDYVQTFSLATVNQDGTAYTGSYYANDMIYLQVAPHEDFPSDFFYFAPTLITVYHDGTDPFVIYDVYSMPDTCGYDTIDFAMHIDYDTNIWTANYKLFVMKDQAAATLKVVVDVDLCVHSNSAAICETVLTNCDDA